MSAIGIALISLICSFGGAWVGVLLRERLPDAHLSQDTAEVVKLSTGLVGTMAALVLGLLVASAATEFNGEATGLQTLATDFILLDRALRHYGPEAAPARAAAKRPGASHQPGHVQGPPAPRKRQVGSGCRRGFAAV